MEIKISITKPDWDANPQKTTTNNWNWRQCVIVEFQNQTFKWMPTYKQMSDISNALIKCESINKQLARENNGQTNNYTRS